jgi:DNA-binding beta-propeller fold protein YncE
MSGDGKLLCDCATVEDRVWIVSADTLTIQTIADGIGSTPYWATTSADGNHCFVSMSGSDEIAVLDYKTGKLVTKVKVEDFPQRNRLGRMSEKALAMLTRR